MVGRLSRGPGHKVVGVLTWSWASVDRPIELSESIYRLRDLNLVDAELLDATIQQDPENPFGNPSKARITMRGSLAVLTPSGPEWRGDRVLHADGLFAVLDDITEETRMLEEDQGLIICLKLFEMIPYIALKAEDEVRWRVLKWEYLRDEYILLRPTGRHNEYVRIGMLTAMFYHETKFLRDIGQGVIHII